MIDKTKQKILITFNNFLDLLDDNTIKFYDTQVLNNIGDIVKLHNKYVITTNKCKFYNDLSISDKYAIVVLDTLHKPLRQNKCFKYYEFSDEENERFKMLVNLFETMPPISKNKIRNVYKDYLKDKDIYYLWLFYNLIKLTNQDTRRTDEEIKEVINNKEYIFDLKGTGNIGILKEIKNETCPFLTIKQINIIDLLKLSNKDMNNEIILEFGLDLNLIQYNKYKNKIFISIDKDNLISNLKYYGLIKGE